MTYRVGQVFRLVDVRDGSIEVVLLAQVRANQVQFINVANGNRWSDSPTEVDSPNSVTAQQLRLAAGPDHEIKPDHELTRFLQDLA